MRVLLQTPWMPDLAVLHARACSQAMTGFIKPEVLETFPDDNGTNFVQAASRVGYTAKSGKVAAHYLLFLINPSSLCIGSVAVQNMSCSLDFQPYLHAVICIYAGHKW